MTLSSVARAPAALQLRSLQPFGIFASCERPIVLTEISHTQLEDLVIGHGVVILRGVRDVLATSDLEAYCRGFGPLLKWPFGFVLDVKVVENTRNYLFTHDDVQFHYDGMFAEAEPRYLFFRCIEAPDDGGESLYANTTRAWGRLTSEEQAWLELCVCRYRQERTAHYGGEATVPLVREHPHTGETTLRYAEPVRGIGGNAPELLAGKGDEIDEAGAQRLAELMARVLYEPEVCLTHRWRSGDFVMVDNHRMLHGRRAFGARASRHLQRVHIL